MAVAWLVLGMVLLWIELHHLGFFAIFGAFGSFAAAVVSLIAPTAYLGQGVLFAAVTVGGVAALRPVASRVYENRHRGSHASIGVHGGIVGQEAVTLDQVGSEHGVGHARLAGERWLAVSGDGRVIEPGRTVTVTAIHGTTLVVWPVDGMFYPADHPTEDPT